MGLPRYLPGFHRPRFLALRPRVDSRAQPQACRDQRVGSGIGEFLLRLDLPGTASRRGTGYRTFQMVATISSGGASLGSCSLCFRTRHRLLGHGGQQVLLHIC
ncbi:MAG: hypothetical protein ACE5JB_10755 [bacterium]